MLTSRQTSPLTIAEAAGASVIAFLAFAILVAYFTDWVGLTISPAATLAASVALSATCFLWLRAQSARGWGDLAGFAAIVATTGAWLLRLQWPDLLAPGGGADLAHHLQLVDYIDRHWRLVHDSAVEAYLGEMVHYTPGSHLLASLAGRWTGTDGFHALYAVVALSVALKAGLVFLIARRTVAGSLPLAILAPVLLLLPHAFSLGSFTRYSYMPQVVSECFAVAAWWAVVVWEERPSRQALAVFAIAGAASFLTWPVFAGPPVVALAVIVWLQQDVDIQAKAKALAAATAPIAIVALAHAIGRLGWAKIVRTDANIAPPAWSSLSWPFLALAAAGLTIAVWRRRGLTTTVLIAAIAAQAAVLFVLARTNGAAVPYMAIKMAYLAIYPLAVCAAMAVAVVWSWTVGRVVPGRVEAAAEWALLAALCFLVVRTTLPIAREKPTVSESLYQAGRWARERVADPSCIDYIVADNHTAYWLHLAVTGNRRMSPRTADDRTFDPRQEIIRWINAGGLRYTIADLTTIPKDVLAAHEELARFGSAVVIERRGSSTCAQ